MASFRERAGRLFRRSEKGRPHIRPPPGKNPPEPSLADELLNPNRTALTVLWGRAVWNLYARVCVSQCIKLRGIGVCFFFQSRMLSLCCFVKQTC